MEKKVRDLFSVAMAVISAPDPGDTLGELVRALVEDMGYRASIMRLLEPEAQVLELVAAHGLSEAYLAKGAVAPSGSRLDERVLAGEAVELEDVTTDPAFQYGERARAEGIRSVLAVPVRIHDEPQGVLRAYTGEPHVFSDEEREVLAAVAALCGEVFERKRRAAALAEIMRDVASTLEMREVLDRLLHHTVEGLHFSAAVVRLCDEESGELALAGARGLTRHYLRAGERRTDTPSDRCVLSGEIAIVHDLEREGGLPFVEEALAEGIRSVLTVPLRARGRGLGLLRVYSKRVRRFDPHEVRFVSLVAEVGALAIENARLHHVLEERVEELGAETSGWYQFLTLS
jgi:GAF domain-containing protein